jgi:hypothetical protein
MSRSDTIQAMTGAATTATIRTTAANCDARRNICILPSCATTIHPARGVNTVSFLGRLHRPKEALESMLLFDVLSQILVYQREGIGFLSRRVVELRQIRAVGKPLSFPINVRVRPMELSILFEP